MMLSKPGSALSVGFITSMRERVMFWGRGYLVNYTETGALSESGN